MRFLTAVAEDDRGYGLHELMCASCAKRRVLVTVVLHLRANKLASTGIYQLNMMIIVTVTLSMWRWWRWLCHCFWWRGSRSYQGGEAVEDYVIVDDDDNCDNTGDENYLLQLSIVLYVQNAYWLGWSVDQKLKRKRQGYKLDQILSSLTLSATVITKKANSHHYCY